MASEGKTVWGLPSFDPHEAGEKAPEQGNERKTPSVGIPALSTPPSHITPDEFKDIQEELKDLKLGSNSSSVSEPTSKKSHPIASGVQGLLSDFLYDSNSSEDKEELAKSENTPSLPSQLTEALSDLYVDLSKLKDTARFAVAKVKLREFFKRNSLKLPTFQKTDSERFRRPTTHHTVLIILFVLSGHYKDLPSHLKIEFLNFYKDLLTSISNNLTNQEHLEIIKELKDEIAIDLIQAKLSAKIGTAATLYARKSL